MMQLTESKIQSELIEILKDLTQDWEIDSDDENEICPETLLVEDLGFVSVDIIQLVVAVEEHYKQKLGFNELLMKDGRYVDDLSVEQIVSFVGSKLEGGVQ